MLDIDYLKLVWLLLMATKISLIKDLSLLMFQYLLIVVKSTSLTPVSYHQVSNYEIQLDLKYVLSLLVSTKNIFCRCVVKAKKSVVRMMSYGY